jgi:type IV secretion system protein VirB9
MKRANLKMHKKAECDRMKLPHLIAAASARSLAHRCLTIAGATWLAASAVLLPDPAFALREGRPLATDRRIHTIMFSQDEVYRFTGHYGYQSTIEFAPDESIQTISMGDSVSWLLEPSGNRIFLKPIEKDAVTNMTVLTDKRSYMFELHAREASGMEDDKMVFLLRFIYPSAQNDYTASSVINTDDGMPDLEDPQVRSKLNFNYTLRGREHISPIRIFDDGEFTYFEFRNKNADVPAFFLVDSDGREALINYRVRGDYIVVERVWGRFTLRHGNDVACVYNESWNDGPRQSMNTAQNAPGQKVQFIDEQSGAANYAAGGPASPSATAVVRPQ